MKDSKGMLKYLYDRCIFTTLRYFKHALNSLQSSFFNSFRRHTGIITGHYFEKVDGKEAALPLEQLKKIDRLVRYRFCIIMDELFNPDGEKDSLRTTLVVELVDIYLSRNISGRESAEGSDHDNVVIRSTHEKL